MAEETRRPSLKEGPAPSPKAGDQREDEVASLKQELADLKAILMATIRSQPAVTPDSVWAQKHQEEVRLKAELDMLAAQFVVDSAVKTQFAANQMNPDAKKLFKVKVGWCPEIVLRANDEVMAKAYYDKLCGIRAVNTLHAKGSNEYMIVDVTADAEAQEKIKQTPPWLKAAA